MEDKISAQQSGASVTAVISNLPVGTIMPFAGNATKVANLNARGWLLCNGKKVSKNEYPELFEVVEDTCGGEAPDFYLPDLRGVFLRGVDGEGAESGDPDNSSRKRQNSDVVVPNGVLTTQKDSFRRHRHVTGQKFVTIHSSKGGDDIWFERFEKKSDPANITDETGENETRPVNVSVNYIIFAGTPIKPGV